MNIVLRRMLIVCVVAAATALWACSEEDESGEPCQVDADCGADTTGDWGACQAVDDDICSADGQRRRLVTERFCGADGWCQRDSEDEFESCPRDTDDNDCDYQALSCVSGVCDDGTCSAAGVDEGWCVIDGECIEHGAEHPDDICRSCDTTRSTDNWSVDENWCFIDEQCVQEDTPAPDDDCQVCAPQKSQQSRSPHPNCFAHQISAGQFHSCAIGLSDELHCWGGEGQTNFGQAYPPEGTFVTVDSGDWHSCAVDVDQEIHCWGSNDQGQIEPPDGSFVAVSAGHQNSCAIDIDQTLHCWGYADAGVNDPPPGEFVAVGTGFHFGCALDTDHTIECWGNNIYDQLDAPEGTFDELSVGSFHGCALADGDVQCWGAENYGRLLAPTQPHLESISCGAYHSCAIDDLSQLHCWGIDDGSDHDFDQSVEPGGDFATVSAGTHHSCGLDDDQKIHCWGSNEQGQRKPHSTTQ